MSLYNVDAPPFFRVFDEESPDKATTRDAHWGGYSDAFCFDLFVKHSLNLVFKREVSMNHSIKNNTAWPNIDFSGVVFLLVEHLRRCVARRSTSRLELLPFSKEITQSKVSNLDFPVLSNQDIFRFHISVGDSDTVQILKSKDDLTEICLSDFLRESCRVADGIKKISSLHVLHNEEEILGWLDDFVHLNHERVPNGLHYFDLSADPLDVGLLFNPILTENFDGHILSCQFVNS